MGGTAQWCCTVTATSLHTIRRPAAVPARDRRAVGERPRRHNERSGGYHRYRIGREGFLGGERRIWSDARGAFEVRELPAPVTARLEGLG